MVLLKKDLPPPANYYWVDYSNNIDEDLTDIYYNKSDRLSKLEYYILCTKYRKPTKISIPTEAEINGKVFYNPRPATKEEIAWMNYNYQNKPKFISIEEFEQTILLINFIEQNIL